MFHPQVYHVIVSSLFTWISIEVKIMHPSQGIIDVSNSAIRSNQFNTKLTPIEQIDCERTKPIVSWTYNNTDKHKLTKNEILWKSANRSWDFHQAMQGFIHIHYNPNVVFINKMHSYDQTPISLALTLRKFFRLETAFLSRNLSSIWLNIQLIKVIVLVSRK